LRSSFKAVVDALGYLLLEEMSYQTHLELLKLKSQQFKWNFLL
jgi:hypothetical protein